MGDNQTDAAHWWNAPAAAFEAWLATQPDDVREGMGLLEQIERYAAEDISHAE